MIFFVNGIHILRTFVWNGESRISQRGRHLLIRRRKPIIFAEIYMTMNEMGPRGTPLDAPMTDLPKLMLMLLLINIGKFSCRRN